MGAFGVVMLLGVAIVATGLASEFAGSQTTVILNTHSFWRTYVTMRPPVFGTVTDAKPDPRSIPTRKKTRQPILTPDQPFSPFPPADWSHPEFDDSDWWRDPGPYFAYESARKPNYRGNYGMSDAYGLGRPWGLALLCLRGKFIVTDPAQVKKLTFSARFRGGLVIYLNGKEVARGYMPDGPTSFQTLAQDYPPEAFFDRRDVGMSWRMVRSMEGEVKDRLAQRIREVTELSLPPSVLRKGLNVLGIEIHRAAMHPETAAKGGIFCPVGLIEVELVALGPGGIVPNLKRPQGLQVWNESINKDVLTVDYGEPHPPRALRIVGAPGGTFSGQVVVGCDKELRSLQAEVGPLKSTTRAAVISAAAVKVRYGVLSGGHYGRVYYEPTTHQRPRYPSHNRFIRFAKLTATPPQAVSAATPIWVTVHLPEDAAPGKYEALLTIQVEGFQPLTVPVHLTVCRWKLPRPGEYRTFVDMIESPESVALFYQVPLWSDEHFELIGKSFDLMAQVGNRVLYIPLITGSHFGNAHTMVRWMRAPDGSFEHDYSPVEKYLDLAIERMGKPLVVCFYVWDYYLGAGDRFAGRCWSRDRTSVIEAIKGVPQVSLLDPATGAVEEMNGPSYDRPEAAKAFWKPVAEGLRERLEARGLAGALVLGLAGDWWPSRQQVQVWKELLPEATWAIHAHSLGTNLYGVPFGYSCGVANVVFPIDPGVERRYGWQNPRLVCYLPRDLPRLPLVSYRLVPELSLAGGQRGVGRLAGDFFPIPVGDNSERFITLMRRQKQGGPAWQNLGLAAPFLLPGPEGAVPTLRFESLREGVQACEARIFIESALTDETLRARLGEQLAQRAQVLIDERTRYTAWALHQEGNFYNFGSYLPGGALGWNWYTGSGWQQRLEKLFNIAAEVAGALDTMETVAR